MTSEGHLLCGKKTYDRVKLILVQKTTDSLIYSLVSWTSRTQPSIHLFLTIYPFQGHRGVEPLPVKLYVKNNDNINKKKKKKKENKNVKLTVERCRKNKPIAFY